MMDALLAQLRILNQTLQKLADAVAPAPDPGVFDGYEAFRVSTENGRVRLRGISAPDPVTFTELKGIDHLIINLRENTEQFLEGLPCNNVLLYGPRGTGKSSAVKAAFNEYRGKGLRMIEMPRDTLFHLFELLEMIRGRTERFVIFCDDLAFEEEETSYRQLKSVLEGGLEVRPANVLIYATSNRRHLMPERASDNQPVYSEGELHPAESIEEKLSLSDRFGVRLGLYHFDAETYLGIVSNYAVLRSLDVDAGELKAAALRWSLSHGGYSGRTARQFIDDLEGRIRMGKGSPRSCV
ncbi:MAG TPA: ATP-binding protein [Dissulfurispiraceae bacterium]